MHISEIKICFQYTIIRFNINSFKNNIWNSDQSRKMQLLKHKIPVRYASIILLLEIRTRNIFLLAIETSYELKIILFFLSIHQTKSNTYLSNLVGNRV